MAEPSSFPRPPQNDPLGSSGRGLKSTSTIAPSLRDGDDPVVTPGRPLGVRLYTHRANSDPGEPVSNREMLSAPGGQAALFRGMGRMARLLQVTLGPRGRTVAMAPLVTTRPP